ncbi:YbjN domain-containing protein [Georgenia sp. SYP-B2076]|uniref:YbjN domain-containing protein n=1 Tax=Georgenia sp. SYP-B2076 TaxID=2495881 RepID=UPI0013DEF95E|nr:YbjN domain-containing protein [Georgenia sp. SYP-B2076]
MSWWSRWLRPDVPGRQEPPAPERPSGARPAPDVRPRVPPPAGDLRRGQLIGPAERTVPVTAERVRQVVTNRGYHVRTEPDASLSGVWDGYQFHLRLAGEDKDFLSVRGTWGRTVPEDLHAAVMQANNDWNRDKIWPTVFTSPSSEGMTVRTEIMADVSAGATDRQLLDIIEGGLSAGVQFFQALARSMPDPDDPAPDL